MPSCYNFHRTCRFNGGVWSPEPTSRANSTYWPMPSVETSTAPMGTNVARPSRLYRAYPCSPVGCTTWGSCRSRRPRSLGRQLTAHLWHWLATFHQFLYNIYCSDNLLLQLPSSLRSRQNRMSTNVLDSKGTLRRVSRSAVL